MGTAAIVLVWVAMLGFVGFIVATWRFVDVVNRTTEQDVPANQADVAGAGATFGLTFALVGLLYLAAGIVYWVWSWRARFNAELLAGPASQELSPGWTFWGWLCPLVNFWFPCQVMIDIYRASSTRQPRGAGFVIAWWIVSLCCLIVPEIIFVLVGKASTPDQLVRPFRVSAVVIFVLLAGSAALVSVIVNRVSDWQRQAIAAPGGVAPHSLSW
jgi:hypothetical protein